MRSTMFSLVVRDLRGDAEEGERKGRVKGSAKGSAKGG